MNILELIKLVQNITMSQISQSDIARALNLTRQEVNRRVKRGMELKVGDVEKIENYFKISIQNKAEPGEQENAVGVIYRPDVYLSAGYGYEVQNEEKKIILLDSSLFVTDRGIKINPNNCEIVNVSGNSMSPDYKHGDRVIIDKSVTQFIDGHIFAFKYNGECYIKEINVIGRRIKCIPINKEYDSFIIEPDEEVIIFGRILPRIRS